MSAYFWNSMNFELRDGVPDHVLSVLSAVACDESPDRAELELIHPVARYYLSDWRRLVSDREQEPLTGPPLRLARDYASDRASSVSERGRMMAVVSKISIEWIQHDDAYANGGWVFELWIRNLVHRPTPSHELDPHRQAIGWSAMYPNDAEAEILYVDKDGFASGDDPTVPFDEYDRLLEQETVNDWEPWLVNKLSYQPDPPPAN